MKRGDILLVDFEPVRGSEQGRIRPAVIIQNDLGNAISPITIVAAVTKKKFTKSYPTNVFISRDESGLDYDSTILLNQIRTIDKSRIIKRIGQLDGGILGEVDIALKVSLGLN